jgi:hypothetical protein
MSGTDSDGFVKCLSVVEQTNAACQITQQTCTSLKLLTRADRVLNLPMHMICSTQGANLWRYISEHAVCVRGYWHARELTRAVAVP